MKDYLGNLTVKEAASRLGVTRAHLSRILNGYRNHRGNVLEVTGTSRTSPEFWLWMQVQRDLSQAQQGTQPKVRPFPHTLKHKDSVPA